MILKVHLEAPLPTTSATRSGKSRLATRSRPKPSASSLRRIGPARLSHDQLRDRIVAEMSEALTQVGDTYRAPDGVLYSLTEPDVGPGRR